MNLRKRPMSEDKTQPQEPQKLNIDPVDEQKPQPPKPQKADFGKEEFDNAVNTHIAEIEAKAAHDDLDAAVPRRAYRPPHCARESDVDNGIYVTERCNFRPRPNNCKLCNPAGAI